jgi:predicted nucleotidyltransferase
LSVHQAVERVVIPFLVHADAALPAGYSAVLYGSAARGDFVPGWSNINLLVVADRLPPEVLRGLGRGLSEWRKATHEPPLLVTRAEWTRASDVFPIEITDMRAAHNVLRGDNPLDGLEVSLSDLRAELERELRGKLLRLRQGYAARSADQAALGDLAARSASTMLVLLRGVLTLEARPIPSDPLQVATVASAMMGIESEGFLGVVRHRGEAGWRCSVSEFEAYLDAVARAAGFVDQLKLGEQR